MSAVLSGYYKYNVVFLWKKLFVLLACSELRTLRNRNSLHMDEFIVTPFPTSLPGFSPTRPCEVERTLGLRLDTTVCLLGH